MCRVPSSLTSLETDPILVLSRSRHVLGMLGVRYYLSLHIELVILLLLVLDRVVVLYSVVTDTAVLILSSLPAHRN